jgi:hypothetical protein
VNFATEGTEDTEIGSRRIGHGFTLLLVPVLATEGHRELGEKNKIGIHTNSGKTLNPDY